MTFIELKEGKHLGRKNSKEARKLKELYDLYYERRPAVIPDPLSFFEE